MHLDMVEDLRAGGDWIDPLMRVAWEAFSVYSPQIGGIGVRVIPASLPVLPIQHIT